jgi:hypothetical protein
MSSPADEVMGPDDRAMLDRLRSVAAKAETAPPEVLQAARAAFLWRRIDEELAELTVDSAEDLLAAAGVRDAEEGRLLVFEVKGRLPSRWRWHPLPMGSASLANWYRRSPGRPGSCMVRTAVTAIDELGCFAVRRVTSGPVRLELHLGGVASIVADPVLL